MIYPMHTTTLSEGFVQVVRFTKWQDYQNHFLKTKVRVC